MLFKRNLPLKIHATLSLFVIIGFGIAVYLFTANMTSTNWGPPIPDRQPQLPNKLPEDPIENLSEEEIASVSQEILYGNYPVNDTGQVLIYDDYGTIDAVDSASYPGQDGSYTTNEMNFTDNNDGTVTDLTTGLMWQQHLGEKMTYEAAVIYAESLVYAGYDDWRLPTIKELYALIDFSGNSTDTPYIDTDYFEFHWGTETGERAIDAQYASSTLYQSTTMNGNTTMFGVNFADGRIKGYPIDKLFYVMLVRGNDTYGINQFIDNGDGTISDYSTGLMWMKYDNAGIDDLASGLDWQEALQWAESLDYAGYDDWKLPDAKELQSIVDYTRSPDTTQSAAINPMFDSTQITNMADMTDYGYYWTSTTHAENDRGHYAVYLCFGRGMGSMFDHIMDVHGAGAQRSDPKSGSREDYPLSGQGPQGDVQRVYNFARAVRVMDLDNITDTN